MKCSMLTPNNQCFLIDKVCNYLDRDVLLCELYCLMKSREYHSPELSTKVTPKSDTDSVFLCTRGTKETMGDGHKTSLDTYIKPELFDMNVIR